ncbi:MAG TPA: flagellar hook-basal body complex protein FliE [Chloroflexota bacterium]|nr:flagellar hook-basal body complex protein FliE [Chloroflexota bacterium]
MQISAAAMRAYALNTPSIGTTPAVPSGTPGAGNTAGGFGQALTDALSGISESQNAASAASAQMAAGDPIDLHEVMLADQTASLQFQLAVQVRNKLVEAYQDVMRMQI